jgi:hypothetical protein
MRIIAYTYEADVHCLDCAQARFAHLAMNGFHWVEHNNNPVIRRSYGKPGIFTSYDGRGCGTPLDANFIPVDATDREGNPVHPVYDIDEDPDGSLTHCGDCGGEL